MAIKEDVIFGQQLMVGATGAQRIRVFVASDLPHGSGNDPLVEAYEQLKALGVDYGEPHSQLTNISVQSILGETFNNTPAQAKLTVTYAPPDYGGPLSGEKVVTLASTAYRRLVKFDRHGQLIKVTYNGKEYTGAEVETTESHDILEFEYESGDPPPEGLRNAVNDVDWENGAPGQWLCRERMARRIIARTLWRIKLSFEFKETGWDEVSAYRDPFTQKIPEDVDPVTLSGVSGNGWTRPDNHPRYNFNLLGLPKIYS